MSLQMGKFLPTIRNNYNRINRTSVNVYLEFLNKASFCPQSDKYPRIYLFIERFFVKIAVLYLKKEINQLIIMYLSFIPFLFLFFFAISFINRILDKNMYK